MSSLKFSALLVLYSGLLLNATLHARIGESRNELERRLTSNRRAMEIDINSLGKRQPKPLHPLEDALANIADSMSNNYELVAYFKKAVDDNIDQAEVENVQQEPGWVIQVIYVGGRSVAEAYVRRGSKMTQFERDGLMALQKGNSNWVNAKELKGDDIKEFEPFNAAPIFKAIFFRSDKHVGAASSSGGFVFYDLPFQARLVEKDQKVKQSSAPESLIGF